MRLYNKDLDYGFETSSERSPSPPLSPDAATALPGAATCAAASEGVDAGSNSSDLYATGGKWRVEKQRLQWDVLVSQ